MRERNHFLAGLNVHYQFRRSCLAIATYRSNLIFTCSTYFNLNGCCESKIRAISVVFEIFGSGCDLVIENV